LFSEVPEGKKSRWWWSIVFAATSGDLTGAHGSTLKTTTKKEDAERKAAVDVPNSQ
jgi:hypothetical protein